jgi:glycosyltransferase involved in cell wall biosynthesis
VSTPLTIKIIFTDPHLPYSPTTLQLYDALKEKFEVGILAFEPDPSFSEQRIEYRNVEYLKRPPISAGTPLAKRIQKEVTRSFFPQKLEGAALLTEKAKVLIEKLKACEAADLIAVDFFALWCVQMAGRRAHLLSLEIFEQDQYRAACRLTDIKSVLIQTDQRYEHLFPGLSLKKFLVQNAPVATKATLHPESRKKTDLLFCGSAMPWFGIFSCLEFIYDFPEYSLTIKGAVPPRVKKAIHRSFGNLLQSGRLVVDDGYLSSEDLNRYLSRFFIGFVFYDHLRFEMMERFNYQTAPSGKLFQYYNSGVPVVANRVDGLQSVQELETGVMIDSLGSGSIKGAIDQITGDYARYAAAAKQASFHFDFKTAIQPFLDFLSQTVAA